MGIHDNALEEYTSKLKVQCQDATHAVTPVKVVGRHNNVMQQHHDAFVRSNSTIPACQHWGVPITCELEACFLTRPLATVRVSNDATHGPANTAWSFCAGRVKATTSFFETHNYTLTQPQPQPDMTRLCGTSSDGASSFSMHPTQSSKLSKLSKFSKLSKLSKLPCQTSRVANPPHLSNTFHTFNTSNTTHGLPPQPLRMWKYNLRAFQRAVPCIQVAVLPAAWHDMRSVDSSVLYPSIMATERLESQIAVWNVDQLWRVFIRPNAAAPATATAAVPPARCHIRRQPITSTTEYVPLIFVLFYHLLHPWACPHTPAARRAAMPVYRATTATPAMVLHWHHVTALLPGLEKLSRLFAGIHDVLVPDAACGGLGIGDVGSTSSSSSSSRRKRRSPSAGLGGMVASPWTAGAWQHQHAQHVTQPRRQAAGSLLREVAGFPVSEDGLWLQFRWAPVAEFLWFLWWEAGWLRDLPFFLPHSLKHKALKNAFTVTILAVHMLLPLLPTFGYDLGAWYAAPLRRFLADRPVAALLTRQSELSLADGAVLTSLPGVPHGWQYIWMINGIVRQCGNACRGREQQGFNAHELLLNQQLLQLRRGCKALLHFQGDAGVHHPRHEGAQRSADEHKHRAKGRHATPQALQQLRRERRGQLARSASRSHGRKRRHGILVHEAER